MSSPIKSLDWFDLFWNEQKHKLPVYLRNDATKELARGLLSASVQSAAVYATTPAGIRSLIALARISAILKGTSGVLDAPDPTPEQVAEAVEKLVRKVKS